MQTRMKSLAETKALADKLDAAMAALAPVGGERPAATEYTSAIVNGGAVLEQLVDDFVMQARLRRTFGEEKYWSVCTLGGIEALYARAMGMTRTKLQAAGRTTDSLTLMAEYARVLKGCIMEIEGAVEVPAAPPAPRRAPKRPTLSKVQAECFGLFWQAYPKKRSKGEAERAWAKLKPSEGLAAQIVQAVQRQRMTLEWQDDSGKYIPYPASWLNAKGWENGQGVEVGRRREGADVLVENSQLAYKPLKKRDEE